MHKISNSAELKAQIRELEAKTRLQEQGLKNNAKTTVQSFKPTNLVRTGMVSARKVALTRDIRSMAINTFIGLAAGYITRKFIVRNSGNIFKRTLGVAVQSGITKMVYRRLPLWQQFISRLIARNNNQRRLRY
jgi:hypothetical protein